MTARHKVGIYPGSFDPIHSGHIAFALQAMSECNLSKVVFLPEPQPRGKPNITALLHRVALIDFAIQSKPGLELGQPVSRRFSVSNSLPKLTASYADAALTFLMGSDVVKTLDGWPHITTLLTKASLAIGLREGDTPDTMAAIMEQLARRSGAAAKLSLSVSASRARAGPQKPCVGSHG